MTRVQPEFYRPAQYGTDGRCPCGARLSRYNPHTLCAPCRLAQVSYEGKLALRKRVRTVVYE